MTRNRRNTSQRIETARANWRRHRKTTSACASIAAILVFALLYSGCQTQWPPLPYQVGPYTTVRLSPGDTIKVAFAENSDLDRKSTRLNSSHVSESRMPPSA